MPCASLPETPTATRIELRTGAARRAAATGPPRRCWRRSPSASRTASIRARSGEGNLYGVGEPLPTTLFDAIRAARADTRITELLGQTAVDDLLLLSEKEWLAFTTQVSAWDIDRYLGAI